MQPSPPSWRRRCHRLSRYCFRDEEFLWVLLVDACLESYRHRANVDAYYDRRSSAAARSSAASTASWFLRSAVSTIWLAVRL